MLEANDDSRNDRNATPNPGHCQLLEGLPAEIREQIWIFAVTDVEAVRIDRLNRPLPAAITRTCRQIRRETLHLYYQKNVFEAWQPLGRPEDWHHSAFMDWLYSIGPERISWLERVVLLYKHERELEYDVEQALEEGGFDIKRGVICRRRELTPFDIYQLTFGLPRQFAGGKSRRRGRYYRFN